MIGWLRRRGQRTEPPGSEPSQAVADAHDLGIELKSLVSRLERHSAVLQTKVDRLKPITDPPAGPTRRTGDGHA